MNEQTSGVNRQLRLLARPTGLVSERSSGAAV
jgi:hypothetical protein